MSGGFGLKTGMMWAEVGGFEQMMHFLYTLLQAVSVSGGVSTN